MNSTTPVPEFYRGPVKNFTLFIECSSILWFGATILEAYSLFILCKRNNGPPSFNEPSRRLKAFVASLCLLQFLHAVLANISHYTLPADLTFDAKTTAPWAMKLTFLTTDITLALCLAYIMRIVGQVAPFGRGLFYYLVFTIALPFVITFVASLASQEITHGTIEIYFGLFGACAVLWNLPGFVIQIPLAEYLKQPSSLDVHRIFRMLTSVILVFLFTPYIVAIPNYIYDKPHIFWAYAQLATYEVSGNAYPSILIGLMCMPGFGSWEQDDDMKFLAV